jgi:uncharacterized protein (TIGR02284 family)
MLRGFHKILCPIEFDDRSLTAVTLAKQIARENEGIVYVMHVIPQHSDPLAVGGAVMTHRDEMVAEQRIQQVSRDYLSDVQHRTLVRVGHPAEEVVKAQRELGADLVVMATHRHTGVFHLLTGRVAARVMYESYSPVLTLSDKTSALDPTRVEVLPPAIEVLKGLMAVCVDSEERYRHAAKDVSRGDLESFFNRQAELCKGAADELQVRCKRLGIVEDESGTFGGLVDRTAMDLSVAMSMGDSGVVDWCRKDAARVVGEYERALAKPLPGDLQRLLASQLREIRMSLDSLDQILQTYGGPKF